MSKRPSIDFLSSARRSSTSRTSDRKLSPLSSTSRFLASAPLQDLAADEVEKVQLLRQAVQPDIQGSVPLQNFVSTSCLVRFLRARSWRVPEATKMLTNTIEWRKEYKPELIQWSDVVEEAGTGKQYILPDTHGSHPDQRGSSHGQDLKGRPVLIMRPRCENTKTYERQMKFVVYHLETVSWLADMSASSNCTLCWIVDFVGYSYSNSPPMKVSMQFLHIMQSHYPERLGVAIAYRAPRMFSFAWKALQPVMDPLTRSKVVFVDGKSDKQLQQQLEKYIDLSMLDPSLSGTSNFEWDVTEYAQIRRQSDEMKMRDTMSKGALLNGH